jgi:pentapeptide MXKDX repeat protein
MKRIGLLLAFFGLLFLVLPGLTAQDKEKKDADKSEKKDAAKKDEAKKDEAKKDEAKKDEPEKKKEKKEEPKKEKLVYSEKYAGKILSVNGRELTIEKKEIDPKKYADAQAWLAQRYQQLSQPVAQAQLQVAQAKDVKGRASAMQNLAKAQATYSTEAYKVQVEMAKKDVTTAKSFDVRAHDDAKVRTMVLPVEFDDLGFEKKWTKKEIEERKDKTGLPGLFPTDFDQLKAGQYVDVYMAKAPPKDKDKDMPKKKKAPDDDVPEVKARPDFILIVIQQQPAAPK